MTRVVVIERGGSFWGGVDGKKNRARFLLGKDGINYRHCYMGMLASI